MTALGVDSAGAAAGEVSPSPTTTDDKRRACGAHDDCSGTGPDCFDPNICSACDGEGCEEGCGRRLGCRDAYSGPDSHKVCPRCGGTGRVTPDSAKPVAPLPNWPKAAR